MFMRNVVIEWLDDAGERLRLERVLHVEPQSESGSGPEIVVIDRNPENEKALPEWHDLGDYEAALDSGSARILDHDPHGRHYPLVFEELPNESAAERDKRRRTYEQRDRRWRTIQPIVTDIPNVFTPSGRGQRITDIHKRSGFSKVSLRKWLRRYWQEGMTSNALMDHFEKCGAPGQPRRSDRKLGRPHRLQEDADNPYGRNLTDDDKAIFGESIRQFYEKPLENGKKVSLEEAYQKMVVAYYATSAGDDTLATRAGHIPKRADRPSFDQFHHFYYKVYLKVKGNYERSQRIRHGNKAYNTRLRGNSGRATDFVFGPGMQFQIDATRGNSYLVSSLDRSRIIGRAIIYVVSDTWSRKIVSIDASLEGPSWSGARRAIEILVQDKVAFCKSLNIDIQPEDWPVRGFPYSLIADNAELSSNSGQELLQALGIRNSEIEPPFRPDWKHVVENDNKTLDEMVISHLPGYVRDMGERGIPDYRLEARLTLFDLRRLLVKYALHHNNHTKVVNYPKDRYMIADHVRPYPLELWNWGIKARTGALSAPPYEEVHVGLMKRFKVSVTRDGIRYKNLYYECRTSLDNDWTAQARAGAKRRVVIAVDHRSPNEVYLIHDENAQPEPCRLVPSSRTFAEAEWDEINEYFASENRSAAEEEDADMIASINFAADRDQIISEATAPDFAGRSKRQILGNITEDRRTEREYERGQHDKKKGDARNSPSQKVPRRQQTGASSDDYDIQFLKGLYNDDSQ